MDLSKLSFFITGNQKKRNSSNNNNNNKNNKNQDLIVEVKKNLSHLINGISRLVSEKQELQKEIFLSYV